MSRARLSLPRRVQGSALLDAMISILIFSIGILGVVKLQSSAVTLSTDAKYRADAAMLADQAIAAMWTSNLNTLASQFAGANGSGGTAYAAWNARVAQLPSGVGSIAVQADGNVTVTVQWKLPGEKSADPHHSYVAATQVAR